MRTELFNRFTTLDDRFPKDMTELWELKQRDRDKLLPEALALALCETTIETKKIRERTVASVDAPSDKVLRALDALTFVARSWNPFADKPEDCIRDIVDLHLVPDKDLQEAKRFLGRFFKRVAAGKTEKLKRLFAYSLLPSFGGASTLIDMRAVLEEPFGAANMESVSGYKPKLVSWVPIIIVKMSRDSDVPLDFVFQCTESQLGRLLAVLQAAQKDLKEVQSRLGRKGS